MSTKEVKINVTTGASVKAKKNLSHTTMKRIKITSNGPLTTKGGVRGPVLRPYMETIYNIRNMLVRDKATIIEILKDGSELQLTAENYMLDNNEVISVEDAVTPLDPAPAETVVITQNEEVTADVIPEDAKPEEVVLDKVDESSQNSEEVVADATPEDAKTEEVSKDNEEAETSTGNYYKNKKNKKNH